MSELVAGLPESVRSTLPQTTTRVRRPTEDGSAERSGGYPEALAAAARGHAPQDPTYDEDRMLPRLVREAIFHRDEQRRQCAALLVAASPFGPPVAYELLGRLSRSAAPPGSSRPSGPSWLRAREAGLVRFLCTDRQRRPLVALLDEPVPEVAVPLLEALGQLTWAGDSDRVLRGSLGPVWSPREQATLYAMGMSGSPGLAELVGSVDAPRWQRSAGRWWLDQGPSLWA
jgi:hypothetical protein